MWTGKDQHISVPRCVDGLVLFLSKRLRFAKSMDVVQVVGDGWVRGIPRHRLRQGVGWREGVCLPRLCAAEFRLGNMPHRRLPLRGSRAKRAATYDIFWPTRKAGFEAFKRISLQYWLFFLRVRKLNEAAKTARLNWETETIWKAFLYWVQRGGSR